MKKILFGIFAHPDDEAFGPAGTLLKETRSGTELHLICLTAGDAGMNPDNVPDLSKTRLKEWQESGALLGARSMHFLGYKDGQLNNQIMIEAGQQIVELIAGITRETPQETQIDFMSFDLSGLSGHIDHIVAARATCWAFYTLKKDDPRLNAIHLFCLSEAQLPTHSIDWLYKEQGRSAEEIGETIDTRDLQGDIIKVMRAHHTQRADCDDIIKTQAERLGLNNFVIKS